MSRGRTKRQRFRDEVERRLLDLRPDEVRTLDGYLMGFAIAVEADDRPAIERCREAASAVLARVDVSFKDLHVVWGGMRWAS